MAPYDSHDTQRVIVLGDSTIENKLPVITALWEAAVTSPLLKAFLQQAIEIIQEETHKLYSRSGEGLLFLRCINILEAAKVYAQLEDPDEIIASTLALVARFGALVLDAEQNETFGSTPSANVVHILGFCTGLLPGAVAACAADTFAVFDLACDVLAISFRLVIALVRRSKAIEPAPGLWATTFIKVPRQELQLQIDGFNASKRLPSEMKAFIGVTSKAWNTVFAPPSTLEQISVYPILSQTSQIRTTAALAVHAPHLARLNLDWIIGSFPGQNVPISSGRVLVSTSTGKPFRASTLGELLPLVVADISMNLLDIDPTIDGVCRRLNKLRPLKITAMGPSPNIPALTRRLATAGFQFETTVLPSTDQSRRPRRRDQ